jgi:chromate reductase, NAD(P)H dehydrogenase (quinone)
VAVTDPARSVKILGFAGSLRQGSYNRAALRAAVELMPAGGALETFDLAAIPLYNGDVEAQGVPAAVERFKAAIAAADGLLIVTPEYNYSIPGVLKNAIDWASRPPNDSPLNGKPVAFMGASMGGFGTVRSQLHLRQVCVFTNMYPLNRPEVHISTAQDKFDADGRLTDERTREAIRRLLAALLDWTVRLRRA